MHFFQLHQQLKELFEQPVKQCFDANLGVSISHFDFISDDAKYFLSGSDSLFCSKHNVTFSEQNNKVKSDLKISDFNIECNKSFQYHLIQNDETSIANGVIIMFHGLNEKKWDKYLPWAYELAKRTKKAILLFPIGFHMDRAPEIWSSRKEMFEVAQKRKSDYIDNSECSYVNAAISSRLEDSPQRIFWSGLQTYSDIIRLVLAIRKGEIQRISTNATFDLFGYSIGSFLSMILLMANPKGVFTNSKLFCFCGGMTMDRMYPISKYIMDSRAAIEMQKMFTELLSTNFVNDARLAHYQNHIEHENESWFKTMLRYNFYQEERESRIKQLQSQIKSFVLQKDRVTPPIEALNTLKGGFRTINVDVQIEDFNHPYSHIMPFPLTSKNANEVDQSFNLFLNSASDFFNN